MIASVHVDINGEQRGLMLRIERQEKTSSSQVRAPPTRNGKVIWVSEVGHSLKKYIYVTQLRRASGSFSLSLSQCLGRDETRHSTHTLEILDLSMPIRQQHLGRYITGCDLETHTHTYTSTAVTPARGQKTNGFFFFPSSRRKECFIR